jgi:PAS domain S-box-containing protein
MDWLISVAAGAAALTAACAVALAARRSREASKAKREAAEARTEATQVRRMLDHIHDAIALCNFDGETQYVNARFRRMFRVAPGEQELGVMEDYFDHRDRWLWRRQLEMCSERTGEVDGVEYRGKRTDGATLPLECTATVIVSGGLKLGILVALRDISHLRLIETSQRALARQLEFFVRAMPLGCIIWDLDFSVQDWNEAAGRIFGWTAAEAMRRRYAELLAETPGDSVERAWDELRSSRAVSRQQCRNRTKTGGSVECEWFHTALVNDEGEVVAVASMVHDVTERVNLQQQLLHSQKLEAIGTLAGGVAHDFNNLLTTILGNVNLARMHLGPSHPAARGLTDAETAAERAAELTRQLLGFSRKSPAEVRPVQINDRLREAIELFRHSVPAGVEVHADLASDLWEVAADAGQIGQVVMNLCLNARDAVGENGWVRVATANRTLDREFQRTHAWARSKDYVEITVGDNGAGMDEKTRERIFEPFFTTKPVGQGTGLGLATAYGIVENHGGGIEVESAPGKGTAFHVWLPRYEGERTGLQKFWFAAEGAKSCRVLVVDDEADVRRLARAILSEQGFEVTEARDGMEAVEQVSRQGDEIGVVILDLVMPKQSGRKAFEEIRRLRPSMPVILSTGYAFDGMPVEESHLLAKPYKPEELLQAVRGALAAAAAQR